MSEDKGNMRAAKNPYNSKSLSNETDDFPNVLRPKNFMQLILKLRYKAHVYTPVVSEIVSRSLLKRLLRQNPHSV